MLRMTSVHLFLVNRNTVEVVFHAILCDRHSALHTHCLHYAWIFNVGFQYFTDMKIGCHLVFTWMQARLFLLFYGLWTKWQRQIMWMHCSLTLFCTSATFVEVMWCIGLRLLYVKANLTKRSPQWKVCPFLLLSEVAQSMPETEWDAHLLYQYQLYTCISN